MPHSNHKQCLGKKLGMIDQNRSVSKSNWLHVDIFQDSSRIIEISYRFL